VGVDTVKLSYPLGTGAVLDDLVLSMRDPDGKPFHAIGQFWSGNNSAGTMGPVRYRSWSHPGLRVPITVKGVPGSSVALVYEGSVPKELGVLGAAEGDCVDILDSYIRRLLRESGLRFMPRGRVRRLDLTQDEFDPDGWLRSAALGWMPHERSRYVQSVHDDRTSTGHTVFQHNKTRGVRVYDKYHESKEEWARGLTRIEYQVRGAWIDKYGIELGCDWRALEGRILRPLVADLKERAGQDAARPTR